MVICLSLEPQVLNFNLWTRQFYCFWTCQTGTLYLHLFTIHPCHLNNSTVDCYCVPSEWRHCHPMYKWMMMVIVVSSVRIPRRRGSGHALQRVRQPLSSVTSLEPARAASVARTANDAASTSHTRSRTPKVTSRAPSSSATSAPTAVPLEVARTPSATVHSPLTTLRSSSCSRVVASTVPVAVTKPSLKEHFTTK